MRFCMDFGDTKVIPYEIQEQLQKQDIMMMKGISQEQQKALLEMKKRLSERIDQREETRVKKRDEMLMKTFREIQETKKLMREYKEEIAVTKEENRAWWKFWK
ncbi:hypothetical protein COE58_24305 [Bacillus cereus]|nr:hypothetical protein COE58_24305 [Bacillus cereus]